MNCTRIEKLIPLFVSGDLKSSEMDEVLRHTESCAHCREVVAEFETSQRVLREFVTPKFDELVFDDLRDAVRREITRTELRPSFALFWNPRFVIGGSLALILLIAGLAFYGSQPNPSDHNPIAVVDDDDKTTKIEEPSEIKNATGRRSGQKQKTPGRAKRNRESVAKLNATSRSGRQNTDIAISQAANQNRDPEMLRIEIQTADPNIRIIWLAPKDPHTSSIKPGTNDR
jgi:hypothetical protein